MKQIQHKTSLSNLVQFSMPKKTSIDKKLKQLLLNHLSFDLVLNFKLCKRFE